MGILFLSYIFFCVHSVNTRELFFSASHALLWRIFSPSGMFWWGLKRWRERKKFVNGHFSDQEGGKRHHSRFVRCWIEFDFLILHKNIASWRRGNPNGNFMAQTIVSTKRPKITNSLTGTRLISFNLSLAFCHSHSCWDCRADFSAFSSFHESLMIVAYCEVEKMET